MMRSFSQVLHLDGHPMLRSEACDMVVELIDDLLQVGKYSEVGIELLRILTEGKPSTTLMVCMHQASKPARNLIPNWDAVHSSTRSRLIDLCGLERADRLVSA